VRQKCHDDGAAESAEGWKLPLAIPRRPAAIDPLLPFEVAGSCRTTEPRLHSLRVQEADARGHQDSAIRRQSVRATAAVRQVDGNSAQPRMYYHVITW
jgi:hypothetical protein